MRAVLLGAVAVALVSVAGCGGAQPQTSEPTPLTEAQSRRAQDYEDENSVGMSDQRVSRWRWRGDRKRCYYIVGNRCFAQEQAACKAAKCRDRCAYDDDAAPVRVSCRD